MIRTSLMSLSLIAFLGACAPTFQNHGYAPQDVELAEVIVGSDTKQTVGARLGRPGDTGILETDAWYYVSTQIRTYTYNQPEVSARRVVAIQFDENDVVRDVTVYGVEDGREVELVTRTTETYGRELSVAQQLIGNLFNPGGLAQ